ncbi:Hypothetical protein POVR1_LOCUS360 [uncultured virus]|nr:Hypothetical protein POVR1_LOCUS360 [uncultured virus]
MAKAPQYRRTDYKSAKSFEMSILDNTIRFRTDDKHEAFINLNAVKSDGKKLIHTFRFTSSKDIYLVESNEDVSDLTAPWDESSHSPSNDMKGVNPIDDLKEFYGVYGRSINVDSGSFPPLLLKMYSTCEKAREWIESVYINNIAGEHDLFQQPFCLFIAQTLLENPRSLMTIYDLNKVSCQKFPTYAFNDDHFTCLSREHFNNCVKDKTMQYPYWLRMIDINNRHQLNVFHHSTLI